MVSQRATVYVRQLQLNQTLALRQLEWLREDDLLVQPEARGNCANWVLGHIIANRHLFLQDVGLQSAWNDSQISLYERGSKPISGADSMHLKSDVLMEAYRITQENLVAYLEQVSDEELDAQNEDGTNLADHISFVIWHEAYHTGQFEYLRQLTGVNDSVP